MGSYADWLHLNVLFKFPGPLLIALSGQVCGRIDAVRPVAEIIAEVREQFFREIGRLADQYLASA